MSDNQKGYQMRWRTSITKSLVVLGLGLAVLGVAATPASAEDVEAASRWACKGSVVDDEGPSLQSNIKVTQASCETKWGKEGWIAASFSSYGEHLWILDDWPNGHPTVVYLTVEGSGTAVFEQWGGSDSYDLSYSEGKDVKIKVCTSYESGRICKTQSGAKT